MSRQPQPDASDDVPRTQRGKPACLLIESNHEVRGLLEALIRELDVAVLGVSDALQALVVLERCHVDLIMTEQRLRGPSGTALLRAVRYRWPHVTRVLVSDGLAPAALVRAVDECGAHRVVSKQMHPIALRAEVRAALDDACLTAPDYRSGTVTIARSSAEDPHRHDD